MSGNNNIKKLDDFLTEKIGHNLDVSKESETSERRWRIVKLGEVIDVRRNKNVPIPEHVAFISMDLIPNDGIYCKFEVRQRKEVKSFVYCEAGCLLYTSPSPRDLSTSRMPSSA